MQKAHLLFVVLLLVLGGLQYRLWEGDGGLTHNAELRQQSPTRSARTKPCSNATASSMPRWPSSSVAWRRSRSVPAMSWAWSKTAKPCIC